MKRESKTQLVIFSGFFLTRLVYQWYRGHDHFSLFTDSIRYDMLSDRILSGNFNLDITAFIVAPLYPWFLAAVKWLFGTYWMTPAILIQYATVSMSGVFLYKMAKEISGSEKTALLAAAIYCFFPMTLYFNVLFTQETLFQSFFIFFLYHWRKTIRSPETAPSHKAGFWYALAFLTKSHALLLAPIIALVHWWVSPGAFFQRMKPVLIIAAWSFLLNLPFALINLRLNNTWTWSSGGTWTFFHNGHSPEAYQSTIHPTFANPNDQSFDGNLDFIFDTAYVYPRYGKVNLLPQPQRDRMHRKIALEWIRENPRQFLELKWFALWRFFMPGPSKGHYHLDLWLAGFLTSLPVYVLAYLGLFWSLKADWKAHVWAVAVMGMMFGFYMAFPPESRFRTITLEPVYTLYAAMAVIFLMKKNT